MKKFWNIHKIMFVILTTILLFACDADNSNTTISLNPEDIHVMEKKCNYFGGVKSFNIKTISKKHSDCVRNCTYEVYNVVDSVVCNDGVIIKNIK